MQRILLLSCLALVASCSAPTEESELKLVAKSEYLGGLAREPMVVEHPDGALFVSGFGSQVTGTDWTVPPPLWRSDDSGARWSAVDVGTTEDNAQGNSDVDLAMGPNGTLLFIAMGFNRASGEGTHVVMGRSADLGASWQWQFLSQTRFDDRPWVAIAPDGTAHAIWNDGAGVRHFVSTDDGITWTENDRLAEAGGSSHLAVGPSGRIAVRVSPMFASGNQFDEGVDYIAVSSDAGNSWTAQSVPGSIDWDPAIFAEGSVPRWVEPLAWTDDGVLHHVWSEGSSIKYGSSDDEGATWQIEDLATAGGTIFFPFMTSDGGDRIAATWFVSGEDSLYAQLAVVDRGATTEQGRVQVSEPFQIDAWLEDPENRVPTTAGEYLPVIFLADGDVAVVSPIQDVHNDRMGFTFWRFAD